MDKSKVNKLLKEEILTEITSTEFSKMLNEDPDILVELIPAVDTLIEARDQFNISPQDIVRSIEDLRKSGMLDVLLGQNGK